MRSFIFLIFLLSLVAFLDVAGARGLNAVFARQNSNEDLSTTTRSTTRSTSTSKTSSITSISIEPTNKNAASSSSITTSASSSQTAEASSILAAAVSSSTPTSAASSTPTPSSSANSTLPISPALTPALGIAGAVMIISGIAYTILSSRSSLVNVTFSFFFLGCLACSALIVYCAQVPVSDAKQGGFFVAIVVSGVIMAVVTAFFQDVLQGSCCLLGGFCFSMWLLVCREGSLIPSLTGRRVFILILSFAILGLYFTVRIRQIAAVGFWTSVLSISFSGATVTVLGIDCFARAGLKEFWLYIWAINSDLFPLNTNTYPVTRGIQMEIAGIILLTIMGIASHAKLHNMVKERRIEKKANAIRREQNLAALEAALGREIEETNVKEREQWEATYGGISLAKSLNSSNSSKASTENRTTVMTNKLAHSSVQNTSRTMDERRWTAARGPPIRGGVRYSNSHDDEIQQIGKDRQTMTQQAEDRPPPVPVKEDSDVNRAALNRASVQQLRHSVQREAPVESTTKTASRPIPEPQKNIEAPEKTVKKAEKQVQSIQTNRVSRLPVLSRRMSRTVQPNAHASQEELASEQVDDDDASSIGATLDGMDLDKSSLPAWSRPTSEVLNEAPITPMSEIDGPNPDDSGKVQSPVKVDSLNGDDGKNKSHSTRNSEDGNASQSSPSSSKETYDSSTTSALEEGILAKLPKRHSKVIQSHMTSEWAKYAVDADKPEPPSLDLVEPDSPGIQVEFVEQPVPVDIDDLLRAEPESNGKRTSASDLTHGSFYRKRDVRGYRPISAVGVPSTSVPNGSVNVAQAPVMLRQPPKSKRASRRVSAPIMERPVLEEAAEAAATITRPGSTVQQRGLLRPTVSSMTFHSSPNLAQTQKQPVPTRAASYQAATDPDSVSLSDHRQHLKRESALRALERPHSIARVSVQLPSNYPAQENYDSHQPQRMNNFNPVNQADRYAKWRESANNLPKATTTASGPDFDNTIDRYAHWRQSTKQMFTPTATTQPIVDNERRAAMLNEQRQREQTQRLREEQRQARESAYDQMMRRDDMRDLHREHLRKMQAKATKAAEGASN